jgi:vesicle-fusing ATPase
LRPGRLEIHLEISLPDEKGRLQIFNIHTKRMRDNDLLDKDVDLSLLASKTKNYTGAEIEAVCRSATSFALFKDLDLSALGKAPS